MQNLMTIRKILDIMKIKLKPLYLEEKKKKNDENISSTTDDYIENSPTRKKSEGNYL